MILVENPKDLFDKGTKLIANCAWAQGFALLNKAGETNYDPANRLLGELALKDDLDSALAYYLKINQKTDDDAFKIGEIYFKLKRYDYVYGYFNGLTGLHDSRVFEYLEKIYYHLNDKEAALGCVKERLQIDGDFELYKKAKQITNGLIDYQKASVDISMHEEQKYLDGIIGETREIELVDEDGVTVVNDGFLALDRNVKMLIVNAQVLLSELLDESIVQGLFLKEKVILIQRNALIQGEPNLRYIYVSSKNKSFCSEDNVLFSKNKKHLIAYACLKPEEEYHVPKEVSWVFSTAFAKTYKLRRLYISRKIDLSGVNLPDNIEVIYEE